MTYGEMSEDDRDSEPAALSREAIRGLILLCVCAKRFDMIKQSRGTSRNINRYGRI